MKLNGGRCGGRHRSTARLPRPVGIPSAKVVLMILLLWARPIVASSFLKGLNSGLTETEGGIFAVWGVLETDDRPVDAY